MTESQSTLNARDFGLKLEHINLTVEPERGVARLLLDRPAQMNIISMAMRDQIAELFRALERDGRTRVVILRGAGDRAFTSGGDIPGFMEKQAGHLSLLHHNVAAPERFPGLTIAAIDGYCMGVGLELALACDFRLATPRSIFAFPEIGLGMIPGSGGSQRAPRLIGMTRAKDMVLRSRRISGQEAYNWGLLTMLVEPDQLDAAADSLASELLARPRLALETAKRVLNLGQDAALETALQLEGFAYGMLRGTHDFAEGVSAFVEKRRPVFRHEA